VTRRLAALRAFLRRHPSAVTVGGTLIVAGALAVAMIGKHHEFAAALHAAPIWILGIAVVLHLFWLVARSEAWNVCVAAAGGRVGRRRLYRAASIGYLGNTFNGHFGMAVRIAALRRSAPADSPRTSVLLAAETPILVVEAALAALMSFTLIGPLGLPFWVPLIALAVMVGLLALLQKVARNRREGFWRGLAVMRGLNGRSRIIGLVLFAVLAQIARNWFLLQWTGVDASVLDSVALLIGVGVIGLLPVGPSLGAAAAVVILGTNGVAATAAAGAMLTVTAAIAALCFATWALVDRVWRTHEPQPAV
jgi:uncharacterized membrane protein YbhN (UPF0104 family)